MSSTDQAQQSIEEAMGEVKEEEPSMEDILSSIRRIISDDDEEETAAPETPAQSAETEPAEMDIAADKLPEPDPDPVTEAPTEPAEEEVLELTDIFNEEQPAETQAQEASVPEPESEPVSEIMDISDDEIEFAEAPSPAPEPVPAPAQEPQPAPVEQVQSELLSADAELASSAAFNQLAATILSNSQQTRTVEDLIQEMLKPMLKTWLDENLPDTVERLVREEIERVARRR